jgi:hypothetical protein
LIVRAPGAPEIVRAPGVRDWQSARDLVFARDEVAIRPSRTLQIVAIRLRDPQIVAIRLFATDRRDPLS